MLHQRDVRKHKIHLVHLMTRNKGNNVHILQGRGQSFVWWKYSKRFNSICRNEY